ncbi:MAG: dihydrolipoamide acetyltransferase family protein [Myxococcota bacterium]
MPRLGESIVEATVTVWKVRIGDFVRQGQVLAEVETDKASNEIPSPRDGTVDAILCEEGVTVPVGQAILRLSDAAPTPNEPRRTSSESKGSASFVSVEPSSANRLAPHPVDRHRQLARTSPAVRRAAKIAGIDLSKVTGTGRKGRVTLQDLQPFLTGPKATGAERSRPLQAPVHEPGPRWPSRPLEASDEVRPLTPMRRRIAENLRLSLETAIHVFAVAEFDLHRVQLARAQMTSPPSVLCFVAKAVLEAMDSFPELNGTLQEDRFIVKGRRNLGIATDTERGLVVPVIHDAQHLSLTGLQAALETLAERARNAQLSSQDLLGGTFTISNPGRLGNLFGVSIIRPPEVAILRLGAATKRVVVVEDSEEDRIVVRPMMMAALTYDHRVIDGALANRFLDRVRRTLETWDGSR